jgi:hypothetical protein
LASQLRLDGNAFLCDIVYQKGDLSIADKIYDIRPIMERAFGTASSSAGGSAIDHGSLTGLIDDDHDQYYNSSRIDTWLSGKTQDDIADGSTYKRYSDTEKTKLSGIASGANVNVQSNWDETEPTSDSYIQNKPVIPVDAVTEDFVIAMSIALG